MLRVLMVLEDYSELIFLQTVLKKLGFDVDSTQNPRSVGDAILRLNPEVMLMTAYGKRVKGAEIAHNLRRSRGLPRLILLRSSGTPVDPLVPVEGWLESPVAALDSANMIADLCDLDKKALYEKFLRLHMPEIEHEKARVLNISNSQDVVIPRWDKRQAELISTSTLSDEQRREKYERFLSEPPPEQHVLATKIVQSQVRELRRQDGSTELEDLEQQRRAFVKQLFRNKE